ncbi:MAG: metal ABC transporter permease [Kiritimatiellae bacterium]|nr:metal ABC transporter permease [Kiritimatiellia bacterium]
MSWLMEPWRYAFMVRGLAAGVLVGVVSSVVGVFVVLRGMAFLGDALAHAILPGVAAGYLAGRGERAPMFWGGLAAAVAASLGMGALSRHARMREDTAIGIVFAATFALGIALISSAGQSAVDLSHILFGDILGVTRADLIRAGVAGAGVLVVTAIFYRAWVITAFDPVLAATLRLPGPMLYYTQLVLLAVVIVISIQTVGVAMMAAMLVTPPAAARLVTRSVPGMMAVAAGIGAVSALAGLYVSYYLGIASGAAIVLAATVAFAVAALIRRVILRA